MNRIIWLGLLSLLSLLSPAAAPPGQKAAPTIRWVDCPFASAGTATVDCGELIVPADHDRPAGATMTLPFAIRRSNHANRLPTPILFINGGPGDAAMDRAGALVMPELADSRWDMIFLDQRGTGRSQPNLDCQAAPPPTFSGSGDPLADWLDASRAGWLSCHDYLVAQGIDLSLFNSRQSAADVAALAAALDAGPLHLYAFSYGTFVAQVVMRDHPEAVAAVILDSPLPLEVDIYSQRAERDAAAYITLFEQCAADLGCRLAYPDLEARFLNLVEELDANPASVTLADGQTVLPVDGAALAGYIGGLMANPAFFQRAPALIDDLVGDRDVALTRLAGQFELVTGPVHSGARYTIICREQAGRADLEALAAATTTYPAAYVANTLLSAAYDLELCAQWASGEADAADFRPVTGAIPTLILAGALDFGTPPAWGDLIAGHLDNAYAYTVPGVGHGVLSGGICPNSVMITFLADPGQAPPTGCLAAGDDLPFVINQRAARPWTWGLIGLLSLVLVGAGGRGLWISRGQARRRWPLAWRPSLRLIAWWPPLVGVGILLISWLTFDGQDTALGMQIFLPAAIAASILPLMAGLQAAYIYSPAEEAPVELHLATPRPLAWLIGERLSLVLLINGGLALLATVVSAQITGAVVAWPETVAAWLAPMLLLISVGLLLTLMSRQALFGVVMTAVLWFALLLFGDTIVSRWPFLWPIHIYLPPAAVSDADWWLNRLFVGVAALFILLRALYQLRSEERVLLGKVSAGRSPAAGPAGQGAATPTASVARANSPQRWRLAQLWAIAKAEFKLQWRRRALYVLMLSLLAFPVMNVLLFDSSLEPGQALEAMVSAGALNEAEAGTRMLDAAVSLSFAPTYLVMLLLVPVVVAELVPKDRETGVVEILNGLPLPPAVYLAGKLLGAWLSLGAGLLLVMSASGLLWFFLLGRYALGGYLETWLVGAGSMLLLNGGLGVWLAIGQPTRRRAVFVGLGLAISTMILFMRQLTGTPASFWYLFNPARPILMNYYVLSSLERSFGIGQGQAASFAQLGLGLLYGALQLAAVGLLAWYWLRRRGRI